MKREIKFRAWDEEHNRFDPTVAANILLQLHEPSEEVDHEYGKRFFLQQFIGLLDKNDKEIYEGDVIPMKVGVQQYSNWVVGDPDATLNGAVEWNSNQLCWHIVFKQNKYNIISSQFGWGSTPILEVIGNIFQHPELLTPSPNENRT